MEEIKEDQSAREVLPSKNRSPPKQKHQSEKQMSGLVV